VKSGLLFKCVVEKKRSISDNHHSQKTPHSTTTTTPTNTTATTSDAGAATVAALRSSYAPLLAKARAAVVLFVTPAYRVATKGSHEIGSWEDFTRLQVRARPPPPKQVIGQRPPPQTSYRPAPSGSRQRRPPQRPFFLSSMETLFQSLLVAAPFLFNGSIYFQRLLYFQRLPFFSTAPFLFSLPHCEVSGPT
jgi:hypothetical protein